MLLPAGSSADSLVLDLAPARKLARYLLRNDADAEDVVQEACVRALRYGRRRRDGAGHAWMLTIVRHVGYDWIRRRGRASPLTEPGAPNEIQTHAPSPEAILLAKMNAQSIRESIGRLPANQRRVVMLRYLSQMAYKDIAERDGIPLGTVMSRLARGRENLRALYEGQDPGTARRSKVSERKEPQR